MHALYVKLCLYIYLSSIVGWGCGHDARDARHAVTSMELNSLVPENSYNEGLKNPSEIVISDSSSDDEDVLEGYELTTDNSKDTTSPTLYFSVDSI